MAQSLVPAEAAGEVEVRLPVALDAIKAVEQLSVTNADEEAFAVKVLHGIKEQHAAVEAKRTEITKPLNQALRATNDLFRPIKTAYDKAERAVKQKLADYVRKKAEDNAAQLREAATDATKLGQLVLVPAVAPSGTSMREVWKFEVEDPDAVPREFCSPDPRKLAEMAKLLEDGEQRTGVGAIVAGVRFFRDSIVTSRGRR